MLFPSRIAFRLIMLVCALSCVFSLAVAQEDLTETTYDEAGMIISVSHPSDWVSEARPDGLYLANTPDALTTLLAGEGSLPLGTIGFILYAPSLVDTLDLPEDADNAAALEALIAVRGLPEFSTGTVYDGSPAVVFYQKPEFIGASTDIYAYDFSMGTIFVAMVNTDVDYEITQAVLESVALSIENENSDPTDDQPREATLSVPTAADPTQAFTLTAQLPAGWADFYEEETGAWLLASSPEALSVAMTGIGEYERGQTVIVVGLPTLLQSLEIDPTLPVDEVVSAIGATLEVEAFAALVEGYDVPVAQASILLDSMINGGADIFAFDFADGAVIAVVQPNDGSGAVGVNEILRSFVLTIEAIEEEE